MLTIESPIYVLFNFCEDTDPILGFSNGNMHVAIKMMIEASTRLEAMPAK